MDPINRGNSPEFHTPPSSPEVDQVNAIIPAATAKPVSSAMQVYQNLQRLHQVCQVAGNVIRQPGRTATAGIAFAAALGNVLSGNLITGAVMAVPATAELGRILNLWGSGNTASLAILNEAKKNLEFIEMLSKQNEQNLEALQGNIEQVKTHIQLVQHITNDMRAKNIVVQREIVEQSERALSIFDRAIDELKDSEMLYLEKKQVKGEATQIYRDIKEQLTAINEALSTEVSKENFSNYETLIGKTLEKFEQAMKKDQIAENLEQQIIDASMKSTQSFGEAFAAAMNLGAIANTHLLQANKDLGTIKETAEASNAELREAEIRTKMAQRVATLTTDLARKTQRQLDDASESLSWRLDPAKVATGAFIGAMIGGPIMVVVGALTYEALSNALPVVTKSALMLSGKENLPTLEAPLDTRSVAVGYQKISTGLLGQLFGRESQTVGILKFKLNEEGPLIEYEFNKNLPGKYKLNPASVRALGLRLIEAIEKKEIDLNRCAEIKEMLDRPHNTEHGDIRFVSKDDAVWLPVEGALALQAFDEMKETGQLEGLKADNLLTAPEDEGSDWVVIQ
ncbi:MAG: hypothetical protein H7A37_04165 [Chlamydiales bacterium]|nr:hypothetical protein [Chlamydiia bacterium]MCP5507481.1 hypothetical protein [Chlamydiales bacterium]